jgi:hypothetical protein
VDESKLFSRLDRQEKEAIDLFRACGGPKKPPFDPKLDYDPNSTK